VVNEGHSILRHSPVYLAAALLNRGSGFLLVLIYTHFMGIADYGLVGVVMITAEIIGALVSLQLGSALGRFFFEHPEGQSRIISTGILALIALIAASSLPLWLLAGPLAAFALDNPVHGAVLFLGALATLADALLTMGLQVLRLQRRSTAVLSVSTLRSVVLLGLSLWLVAGMQLGPWGSMLAMVIANGVVALGLACIILARHPIVWSWPDLRAMIGFSLPLLPAYAMEASGKFIERLLVVAYSGLAASGLYYLALRLGELLSSVIVGPFNEIYAVRRYELYRDRQPDHDGARLYTYFFALLTSAALGLALLAPEIVRIVSRPAYAEAASVIPLISVTVVLFALTGIVELGIYFAKRTTLFTTATFVGLLVHIPLVALATWKFGILGTAAARCVSTAVRVTCTGHLARGLGGPLPEWRRLGFIALAALLAYVVGCLFYLTGGWVDLSWRCLVVILFPLLLAVSPLLSRPERQQLRLMFAQLGEKLNRRFRRTPSKTTDNGLPP
jgi:O-antigen/teichoic acid export membrane protein